MDGTRFVWDYWHVPDQYTLLRTPAADFFGDKLFEARVAVFSTLPPQPKDSRPAISTSPTLLRSPPVRALSACAYSLSCSQGLESRLLDFGQERLGCGNISPVWLSNYVHGCRQELHADLPHGPWAFVLSLTPAPRRFTGGETMILKPSVLDYWCAVSWPLPVVAGQRTL